MNAKIKFIDVPTISYIFDVPQIDLLEKITDEELEWLKGGAVFAIRYDEAKIFLDEQRRRKSND